MICSSSIRDLLPMSALRFPFLIQNKENKIIKKNYLPFPYCMGADG